MQTYFNLIKLGLFKKQTTYIKNFIQPVIYLTLIELLVKNKACNVIKLIRQNQLNIDTEQQTNRPRFLEFIVVSEFAIKIIGHLKKQVSLFRHVILDPV